MTTTLPEITTSRATAAGIMTTIARLINDGLPTPRCIDLSCHTSHAMIRLETTDDLAAWMAHLAPDATPAQQVYPAAKAGTMQHEWKHQIERAGWALSLWYIEIHPAAEPVADDIDLHTDVHPQPGDAPAAPVPAYVDGFALGGRLDEPIGEVTPEQVAAAALTPDDLPGRCPETAARAALGVVEQDALVCGQCEWPMDADDRTPCRQCRIERDEADAAAAWHTGSAA